MIKAQELCGDVRPQRGDQLSIRSDHCRGRRFLGEAARRQSQLFKCRTVNKSAHLYRLAEADNCHHGGVAVGESC